MATLHLEIIPRAQFRPYLTRVQRWACLVVHRRAGKTFCCIQDLIKCCLTHKRPGPPLRYGYIAPTRDQAKDIAWSYVKDFFGKIPGIRINEADLLVSLPGEWSLRLYSGENYDRMRGLYFDGVVIDEPADIDPNAWNTVVRPCLSDYNGWATFIGTSKGRNHFWKLWTRASDDPDWFTMLLKSSDSGLIPEEELKSIRKETTDAAFQQEYECDFSVGRPGAIYSSEIERAVSEKRISDNVLWFKELPVYTSFDVGASVNQKCWIFQPCGSRINYLEALSGDADCKTPSDWAARLRERPYSYGAHFIPHDACAENGGLWQDGMQTAGLSYVVGVPRQRDVWDGINLGIDAFGRCYFNRSGTEDGLNALDAYHSREERDRVTIGSLPVHDWASHFADAWSISHQAIKHGLVLDRSAMVRKPRTRRSSNVVISGIGGSEKPRDRVANVIID